MNTENAIVVNYAGRYMCGPFPRQDACEMVYALNAKLSPWERMAGYFYAIQSVGPAPSDNFGPTLNLN